MVRNNADRKRKQRTERCPACGGTIQVCKQPGCDGTGWVANFTMGGEELRGCKSCKGLGFDPNQHAAGCCNRRLIIRRWTRQQPSRRNVA